MQRSLTLGALVVAFSFLGCSSNAPTSAPLSGDVEIDEPSLGLKCVDDEARCRYCDNSGILRNACSATQYCSSGSCLSKKTLGSSCTSSIMCGSGNCVDGYCCSTSTCPGGCNSCTNSGSCQIKAPGSAPGNDCALSRTPPCGATCTGLADCVYPPINTGTCSAVSCVGTKASGYSYVSGTSSCNGTGGCNPPTTGGTNCGNYVCSAGCLSSCTSSTECIDSAYCSSSSACLDKVGTGVECPTTDACAASAGACSAAADGKQRCCTVTCTAPQACSTDGTKCVGTTPFGDACTADDQCATGMCAGDKCVSCKADTDCMPADYCDATAGKCNIRVGIGSTCTTAATCPTGAFCTDGVCCVEASCGVGGTCAGTKKGQCASSNGAACSGDFDCDSGHCVDKVCCDSLCDGQCEACSVDGSIGKCVAVKGAPVGSRPSCDAGTTANRCSAASCDGKDRDKCAALAGSAVVCRETSCATGEAIGRATCDGTGNCPEPVKALCGAYQCAAPDGACRTSCTTDAECSTGNVCRNSQCEPRTSECTAATTSTSREGVEKACAPFLCDSSSGNCFEGCTTSEQCAAGNLCDGGKCVAAPPDAISGSDGGCTTSSVGTAGGAGAWLLLGLALAARSRRSRV